MTCSWQNREDEIRMLRGECKSLAQQAVNQVIDMEVQNQGLREENALSFTKMYQKLESTCEIRRRMRRRKKKKVVVVLVVIVLLVVVKLTRKTTTTTMKMMLCFTFLEATSDGLQKEFFMLKEESDNRMLILENLMREIGGDKVKGMINDISSLQHGALLVVMIFVVLFVAPALAPVAPAPAPVAPAPAAVAPAPAPAPAPVFV
eukprot:751206-Hanusia_phi.AAC.3